MPLTEYREMAENGGSSIVLLRHFFIAFSDLLMGQWDRQDRFRILLSLLAGTLCTASKACYPWFIIEGLTTGCTAVKEVSVALMMDFFSLSADDEEDIDDSRGHPGLNVLD